MNRNDRAIVGLVMLAHGMVHTYELSIPIFVSIWLSEFDVVNLGVTQVGVTEATLGVVVTAGYALFGLGALPGGALVDRIGSRRLIEFCLFGMSVSFLLLGLAPGLVTITIALLLWGAAASVYHPAGLTLISNGVEERGAGLAYHGIAGNLGIGLGPFVTAIALMFFDWTVVAGVLAVPSLVAGAYALRAEFDEDAAATTDGGSDPGESVNSFDGFLAESRYLFASSFVVVFAIVMCSGLYYRGVLTFLPELLGGVPELRPVPLATLVPEGVASAVGADLAGARQLQPERYVYSGLLIVGVLGQYVGGTLSDRVRLERGLATAFVVLALIAIAFLPAAGMGLVPLLVAGALLGFTLFAIQPLYQATVAEYTPPGTRGLSYGFTYLGVFGVGALGGALAGIILTYATPTALFATLAGIAVLGALVAATLDRRARPRN